MPPGVTARVIRPKISPTTILIGGFGTNVQPGPLLFEARKECQEIALELAQEMRDSIYKNRYKKPPLTAAYLKWKLQKGLDRRILIATKKYVKAIGVVVTPFGAKIGIKRGFRIDDGVRLDYWKLQRWLEYGTKRKLANGKIVHTPPRPAWRPMMRYWKTNRAKYGLRIKNRVGIKLQEMLKTSGATIIRRNR